MRMADASVGRWRSSRALPKGEKGGSRSPRTNIEGDRRVAYDVSLLEFWSTDLGSNRVRIFRLLHYRVHHLHYRAGVGTYLRSDRNCSVCRRGWRDRWQLRGRMVGPSLWAQDTVHRRDPYYHAERGSDCSVPRGSGVVLDPPTLHGRGGDRHHGDPRTYGHGRTHADKAEDLACGVRYSRAYTHRNAACLEPFGLAWSNYRLAGFGGDRSYPGRVSHLGLGGGARVTSVADQPGPSRRGTGCGRLAHQASGRVDVAGGVL